MILESVPEEWQGIDLRHYMQSRGVIDVDRAVTIAHGVALELSTLHQHNTIRGNLSPPEVLLRPDCGAIRLFPEKVIKHIFHQYAAPEQFSGGVVTPATDVYSLGIIIYEMLTGHPPFDGATDAEVIRLHIENQPTPPSQINHNIPQPLEEIILRCLEKEPQKRYHDGSQLAQALEALID